ncbi:zinc finger protein 681-like [Chrysoperla carnea]|uniref:zinc finger protein 681-like n=1 Tax=Chrysoperla carnea TaxID=189513 RepID=UPI001D06B399|nr:zinc finger protein 681-like [Chrysoperla carnea]
MISGFMEKVEKEFQTELVLIKSEIFDENDVVEGGQIKKEEGSNDSESEDVVTVKQEPVSDENDKNLFSINYEHIKLEQELRAELIIKSDILDESDLEPQQQNHNKIKPFSCDLFKHKRIHTGEKPFACDFCNKTFNQQSNLNQHKRIHTGEIQFSCDVCNKTFNQQSNLTQHKRIHSEKIDLKEVIGKS